MEEIRARAKKHVEVEEDQLEQRKAERGFEHKDVRRSASFLEFETESVRLRCVCLSRPTISQHFTTLSGGSSGAVGSINDMSSISGMIDIGPSWNGLIWCPLTWK
ncbi:hypothetical protein CR513_14966, partial [Mucuna pruriens]